MRPAHTHTQHRSMWMRKRHHEGTPCDRAATRSCETVILRELDQRLVDRTRASQSAERVRDRQRAVAEFPESFLEGGTQLLGCLWAEERRVSER